MTTGAEANGAAAQAISSGSSAAARRLWPVYLACSWTWCIGMYLPVVLRDSYRWPAVLAFAIPNVLGVMLFGRVLAARGRSEALERGHASAMAWFSIVTVAFHVYFLAVLWRYEYGPEWATASWAVPWLALAVAWIASHWPDRWLLRIAVATYGISLAMLAATAWLHWQGGSEAAPLARPPTWPARGLADGLWLTPVFFLGFLLCPYFDLTFHRALRAVGAGSGGRTTFIHFGLLFALMLAGTGLYAVTGFRWPVTIHILAQSWFTMALHLKEVAAWREETASTPDRSTRIAWLALACIAAGILAFVPAVDYRWWFVFYGLVFPAYAVGAMLRPHLPRRRSGLHGLTMLAIVLLLLPFDFAGFLRGFEWLTIIPAVALAALAFAGQAAPRYVAPRSPSPAPVNNDARQTAARSGAPGPISNGGSAASAWSTSSQPSSPSA